MRKLKMKSYTKAYNRLQEYFSFISLNKLDGVTINTIHHFTNIPLFIIRQDIIFLYQSSPESHVIVFDYYDINNSIRNLLENIHYEHMDIYDDYYFEYEEYDMEIQEDFAENYPGIDFSKLKADLDHLIIEHIQKGVLDDLYFFIEFSSDNKKIILCYDDDETVALNSFLEKNNLQPKKISEPKYHIKESYQSFKSSEFFQKISVFLDAIENGYMINFHYLHPGEKIAKSVSILPLRLLYDATQNLYAVATINEKNAEIDVYHFCRMKGSPLIKKTNSNTTSTNLSLFDKAPHVWGMDFSGKGSYIKVKIYKSDHVIEKIKRDLSYRNIQIYKSEIPKENIQLLHSYTQSETIPNGIIYEENDNYYYEDIVWGMPAFTSWVLSYGSSMIVLAPSELRQQILEDVKKREKYYL